MSEPPPGLARVGLEALNVVGCWVLHGASKAQVLGGQRLFGGNLGNTDLRGQHICMIA